MTATDAKIRRWLEQVDDIAPAAPSYDDLVMRGHSRGSRRGNRVHVVVLIVSFAVLVAALGIAACNRPSTPPADGSVVLAVEPPTLAGLPFAAETELPEGWAYADISEAGSAASSLAPHPSRFLFRNEATSAAVFVQTGPADEVTTPHADRLTSFERSDEAQWAIDGGYVWMRVAGMEPTLAVSLSEQLEVRRVDDDWLVSLDERSGFIAEASEPGSSAGGRVVARAVVTMVTPSGTAQLNLSYEEPPSAAVNQFGVPSDVEGITIYSSARSAVRSPLDDVLAASIDWSNPADATQAQHLLAGLEAVDVERWDAINDQLADELGQLPVAWSLDFSGIQVAAHRSEDRQAVCATWNLTRRCRSNLSPLWGADDAYEIDLIVDGLWITAGAVATGLTITETTATADTGALVGDWQPTSNGGFYAYAFTAAATAEINYATADDPTGTAGTIRERPIR